MQREVIKGLSWTSLEMIIRNTFLILSTILLTRFLEPEQFGIIALLGLCYALCAALADAGLGSVIVQVEEITQEQISTLFWAQMLLAPVFGGLLFFSATLWREAADTHS